VSDPGARSDPVKEARNALLEERKVFRTQHRVHEPHVFRAGRAAQRRQRALGERGVIERDRIAVVIVTSAVAPPLVAMLSAVRRMRVWIWSRMAASSERMVPIISTVSGMMLFRTPRGWRRR
jgi:hypothetical protein